MYSERVYFLPSITSSLVYKHSNKCSGKHGETLCLCSSEPAIPNIPHHAELLEIFPAAACELEINWIAESNTFPRFTQLLALETFTYCVMLGLVVSMGGITEKLVRV